MITHVQRNVTRGSSTGDIKLGQLGIVFMFVLASIGTLIIASLGTSPLSAFFVGEVIIGLFIIDFLRIKILMHVYQIILIYFYFSLVVFHSFEGVIFEQNVKSYPYYSIAYLINCLHFLFFVVGYQLIPTRNAVRPVTPRQNILTFMYIIFGLASIVYLLWTRTGTVAYEDHFLSYEESRSIPIYKMYVSIVFSYITKLVLYLTSHPIFLSITTLFDEILSYPFSGIKGPLLSSFFVLIVNAAL